MSKKTRSRLILFLIILLSVFFRFYQLEKRTIFSYDQEIIAFTAKKILIDRRPVLLGAKTGVGEIHLPPFYFYLYSLPLIFTRMDPGGLAALASLIGVLTTIGFFITGKELFAREVGLLASFVYAGSAWLAHFDRIAWNPNALILTALVLILSIKKIYQEKTGWWLIFAFSLGFSFSLHFSAIFLPLIIAVLFLLKPPPKPTKEIAFLALVIFVFFLLPLVVFDLRHRFVNFRAFLSFLTTNQNSLRGRAIFTLPRRFLARGKIILASFAHLFFSYRFFFDEAIVLGLLILGFIKIFKIHKIFVQYSLLSFLIITLGYSVFSGATPEYYFFLIFPLGIFLVCFLMLEVWRKRKVLLLILIFAFLSVNTFSFFHFRPEYDSLWVKKKVVKFIISRQKGKPFNVSYTTAPGTAYGFSYLFELYGKRPTGSLSDPTYTIIIPYDFEGIKPDHIFYGIGVNLPRKIW